MVIAPGIIDQLYAVLADAMGASLVPLNGNPGSFTTLRADQHHVRDVDRTFELNAAGVDLPSSLRLHLFLVLGTDVDTLDHDATLFSEDVDDLTSLAFILQAAADDFHSVAFMYLHSHGITPAPTLENFRGQRHDLHKLLVTQLAGHGAKDTCATGILSVGIQNNCGII